jgi:uncharacterized protein
MEDTTPSNAGSPLPPVAPVPPVTPLVRDEKAHRQWDMWCHLSALSGLVVPFGNIIGPLIIWQMKRDDFPSVNEHGKEALNFQLSVLIYIAVAVMGMMFLCFFGMLLLPVVIGLPIAGAILSVIAGIKANDGGFYRYPLTIRLVK